MKIPANEFVQIYEEEHDGLFFADENIDDVIANIELEAEWQGVEVEGDIKEAIIDKLLLDEFEDYENNVDEWWRLNCENPREKVN